MIAETAVEACSIWSNTASTVFTASGLRRMRTTIFVAIPNVPSEPTNTPARSKPSVSRVLPPSQTISPSGMTLAGKYGIGIISLGSMSTKGLMSLAQQWEFAEDAARKNGTTVSRADWRVLLTWHVAESREQARREAGAGLMRWHNEYSVGTLMRPGLTAFKSPDEAVDKTAFVEGAASAIGTPDDLVKLIKNVMKVSGGVGAIIGFVHDWANPENTRRSWDLVARYVVPEINGYVESMRKSQKFVIENRAIFERAGEAVMAKIMGNEKAAAALADTGPGRVAIPSVNAPDLQKEAAKRKA